VWGVVEEDDEVPCVDLGATPGSEDDAAVAHDSERGAAPTVNVAETPLAARSWTLRTRSSSPPPQRRVILPLGHVGPGAEMSIVEMRCQVLDSNATTTRHRVWRAVGARWRRDPGQWRGLLALAAVAEHRRDFLYLEARLGRVRPHLHSPRVAPDRWEQALNALGEGRWSAASGRMR
jgi:hypothetical protein